MRHFGIIEEFARGKEGKGTVSMLKTIDGGHVKLGTYEGIQEVIRATFKFP
jgi:hypothetical protein